MSTACHWFQGPSAFPGRRQDWVHQLTSSSRLLHVPWSSPPLTVSKGQWGARQYPQADVYSWTRRPWGPWPGPRKLRSPTSLWILSFLSFPHRRSKRKRPPSARQALGFWTLQGFLETLPLLDRHLLTPSTKGQGARQDHPFRLKVPQGKMLILCLSGPAARPTPGVTHTFFYLCLSFMTWGRTTPFLPCSLWTSVSAVTKSLRLISV